jgi:hypothetical protein
VHSHGISVVQLWGLRVAKCIYREIPLNSNVPADSNTASTEHIIPWALGGSNGLVTPDVSKEANNDLGSDVDAQFADTLPLAIKRHNLQIKSQKGNIPPIVWTGLSPEGVAGTLTIHADGRVDLDLATDVERPEKGEPGPVSVSGPRDRIEPILAGMLKGMKKRKHSAYSQNGKLLESLDDFLTASEQTLVNQLRLSIEYFNQEAWIRGLLKIALAAGHKILESDWTFGPDAGVIRQIVMNPRSNWPASPRGFIAGEWDRSLRLALGKTAAVRASNQHSIAVLPADQHGTGIMAISLFGGDGVPEAAIHIGKLPLAFSASLNRKDNGDTVIGYRVDPRTRNTKAITLAEVDKRIAQQGPTNKKTLRLYQDRSIQ